MRNVIVFVAILVSALCAPARGNAEPYCTAIPKSLAQALLSHGWGASGLYVAVLRNLNDVPGPEAVVLLTGSDWCGTGGCTLLVLEQRRQAWVLVSKIVGVRQPIRELPQRHNGWHALSAYSVGGSTLPGYTAILRFAQHGYPYSTSVPAAIRANHASGGTVLISSMRCNPGVGSVAPDHSFQRSRDPRR